MANSTATCTAESRHGQPCVRGSIPGAPFPICMEHGAELLHFLNGKLSERADTVQAARGLDVEPEPINVPGPDVHLVYYIRVGRYIKIGYTKNLQNRIRYYPPDCELLAWEPGDRQVERERHKQFKKELRMNREWFASSPRLIAHVNTLRETPLTALHLAA